MRCDMSTRQRQLEDVPPPGRVFIGSLRVLATSERPPSASKRYSDMIWYSMPVKRSLTKDKFFPDAISFSKASNCVSNLMLHP